MKHAVSQPLLRLVEAGDKVALLKAVAAHALFWLELAGHSKVLPLPTAANCVASKEPASGLLAAALDLLALLQSSPQGREALRDLGFQPVGEHTKAPGG